MQVVWLNFIIDSQFYLGWEGPGAPCFTVFVASMVLSAPWGIILLAGVDTEGKSKVK